MPGRVDRLGELDRAGIDRAGIDRVPTGPDVDDSAGNDRTGRLESLVRRQQGLPAGHPSSARDGVSPPAHADRVDRAARADGANGEGQPPRGETLRGDTPRGDTPRGDDGQTAGDNPSAGEGDAYDLPDASYWTQVERFEALWQRHVERWPNAPDKTGTDQARPGDPAGSWRSDGARYLSPTQNAQADELIATLRKPEKAITDRLLQIQQDNPHGGHLAGLDHRFKGDKRLKEKIVDGIENEVGTNLADAVNEINDAIRYTFSFDRNEYVRGYGDVCQRLESAGYQMTYSQNHWLDDPQYKGINSRWEAPAGGRFELQFHTPESFHAKEHLTHRSYERLRSPDTSWEELPELEVYQRTIGVAIPEPAEVAVIPDRRERI